MHGINGMTKHTKIELDQIEMVDDLRTIWPDEARNFTPWLSESENLEQLGEAIGRNLQLSETESSVGAFSVDILATTEDDDGVKTVIIENQLTETNHDHLGKLITYAAGKKAQIIVWIVEEARNEHQQAIQWLNEHTDEDMGFYLVQIKVLRIGQSRPAVKFELIEKPNEWERKMRSNKNLTETKALQLRYWDAFVEYLQNQEEFKKYFRIPETKPQHWLTLRAGSASFAVGCLVNTQRKVIGTELTVWNRDFYDYLSAHKQDFEREIGHELIWHGEGKHTLRIYVETPGNIKGTEKGWNEFFSWYCEMASKFLISARKYLETFNQNNRKR